mmetsp:Transcript_88826/g.272036  ORF Transcript_88826/g.272036 Transcript_88826/m.272036 type:complete len:304 (+) Transcript_88826:1230-2141(+)
MAVTLPLSLTGTGWSSGKLHSCLLGGPNANSLHTTLCWMSRYNNSVMPFDEPLTRSVQIATCSRRLRDQLPSLKVSGCDWTWRSMYSRPRVADRSSTVGSRMPSTSSMSRTPSATLTPTSSECREAMFCMLFALFTCSRQAAISLDLVFSSLKIERLNSAKSTGLSWDSDLFMLGVEAVAGVRSASVGSSAAATAFLLLGDLTFFDTDFNLAWQAARASFVMKPSMSSSTNAKMYCSFRCRILLVSSSFTCLPNMAASRGIKAATRTIRVSRFNRVAFVERDATRMILATLDERPAAKALSSP